MKVQRLYFSPTGNTRKVVEAISRGTGYAQEKSIDLTLPKQRESFTGSTTGDLLIVGVPVYASTFPAIIYESLKKLNGKGRLAVPVSVCGDAYVGGCLPEISGTLKSRGFTIVAAANFIGQHSFASDSIPLAYGRPDRDDLQKASEFGRKVAEKIRTNREDITTMAFNRIYIYNLARGNLDAQGSYFPDKYHKDQYVLVSEKEREQCTGCRKCEEICPTGAIRATTLQIDDKLCTRCFACAYVCPMGVLRKYLDPASELAS